MSLCGLRVCVGGGTDRRARTPPPVTHLPVEISRRRRQSTSNLVICSMMSAFRRDAPARVRGASQAVSVGDVRSAINGRDYLRAVATAFRHRKKKLLWRTPSVCPGPPRPREIVNPDDLSPPEAAVESIASKLQKKLVLYRAKT